MALITASFLIQPPKFPLINVFLILSVILTRLQIGTCQHFLRARPCATLYSSSNFQGQSFTLSDFEQEVNFEEVIRSRNYTNWSSTGSFTVHHGCYAEVCDGSYFGGNCTWFREGSHYRLAQNLSQVASVSCYCEKECKCSDIFMKRNSCARAYLQGGCSTCNSLYLEIDEDETTFPVEYADKVEAIRLRKGCKLAVYSEEDGEGDEEVIQEEIVEDFKGKIGSVVCLCSGGDEFVPKIQPERPSYFPPLVDIPESIDQVIKMLTSGNYTDHPGLRAARKSFKGQRSTKNAYILLLGSTGAGKSSTINLLFDNPNVTRVGDQQSTTTNIHEFRIPVAIDELGVANSELRIIDTPGVGDTRGLEQDAIFLATLDDYLSTHEELKDRIPNVVLIFHKFSDNRFNGYGSSFVKMIKGLDSFRKRITDSNYSNVVFVFSHFCSETPKNKRNPEYKLGQFKQTIENFTLLPKPVHIVVAENKGKDHNLPRVNGYFRLPNKEYYPRNLFSKMEMVTEKGRDMIGMGVLRSAFRDSDNFNISVITFPMVSMRAPKVQRHLQILTNAIFVVNQTEVSKKLQKAWETEVDQSLRRNFPVSLSHLQRSLNLRNIHTKDDIPVTSNSILELLGGLGQDEATRVLLEKGLGVIAPAFPHEVIAGYGYNVFKDSYLPVTPFQTGNMSHSEIGFLIPSMVTSRVDVVSKENFHLFDDMEEYLRYRLKELQVEGSFPGTSFAGVVKPGYNIKSISFKNDSCSVSATKEFRISEFILKDKLKITENFRRTVLTLEPFNGTDYLNVENWRKFFNEFGTHVVKSVYVGGSIDVILEADKPFDLDASEALFSVIRFAENIDDQEETLFPEGTSHLLKFHGGSSHFHTSALTKLSTVEATKLVLNWKESLRFNPVVLNTEMSLVPISQFVKTLGRNISTEIDRATDILFNAALRYTPPSKTPVREIPREETPVLTEMLRKQQESHQKMLDAMMQIINELKADKERLQRSRVVNNAVETTTKRQEVKSRTTTTTTRRPAAFPYRIMGNPYRLTTTRRPSGPDYGYIGF